MGIGYLCFYGEGREECVIQALSPDGKFAKLHSRQTGKGFENVPVEDLEIDWKTINKLNEMRRKNGGILLVPFVPKSESPPSEKKERKSAKSRAREWHQMLRNFIHLEAGELTKSEILTWMMIFLDSRDFVTVISQRQIAESINFTQAAVSKAVRKLVKLGLIKVVRKGRYTGKGNRGESSKYRVRGVHINGD